MVLMEVEAPSLNAQRPTLLGIISCSIDPKNRKAHAVGSSLQKVAKAVGSNLQRQMKREKRAFGMKMNEKERKEPPKERPVEKGGPTIPLGRQTKLHVELQDGTIFRHPKKEGICVYTKDNKKCVQVNKQGRDRVTGRKVKIACRHFHFTTAGEQRSALESAVRFRDGLWAEVAAGKSVDQLGKWAKDWEDEHDEKEDSE